MSKYGRRKDKNHNAITSYALEIGFVPYDTSRVVKMTPRCLARFQSFPDSYTLPESARLATTGIGNAVPPLLMQRVLEANL